MKNSATISDLDARRLTEAFLDGQTSLEEERALFAYYIKGDIAEDLEENREMMQWYAAGLKLDEQSQDKAAPARIRNLLKIWVPVAAAVAIVLTLVINLNTNNDYGLSAEEYAMYEGSYIIRNGKKITNLAEIMPEIKANEEYSEKLEHIISENSASSDDLLKQVIYTEYPSPQLRQDILNTLYN